MASRVGIAVLGNVRDTENSADVLERRKPANILKDGRGKKQRTSRKAMGKTEGGLVTE